MIYSQVNGLSIDAPWLPYWDEYKVYILEYIIEWK